MWGKKENGSLTLPVLYDTPDGYLTYPIRGGLTTAGRDDFNGSSINFCHNKQDNHKEILTGSCDELINPNIKIRNKSEIRIGKNQNMAGQEHTEKYSFEVWLLGHSCFLIVSNFVFLISNFSIYPG